MFDTPASPRTMRTLAIVTLALRPKLFPATVVAPAVGRDKATVSRRVSRVGELLARYHRAESEAARDDLAVAIEAVCESLAPGLTPAVLRAAHHAKRRELSEVVVLFAAAERPADEASGDPHSWTASVLAKLREAHQAKRPADEASGEPHKRDQARWTASVLAEAMSEFKKRSKSCEKIASRPAVFVVMAQRHHGRLNLKG